MNNIYTKLASQLARLAFLWFMGALASHVSPTVWNAVNDTIIQLGGQEVVIAGIAGTILTVGTSLWLRLRSHVQLQTAMESPKPTTIEEVRKESPPALSALTSPNLPSSKQ